MTKITEVLKIIAPHLADYTSISNAIALAEKIEELYIFDAEAWVTARKDEYAQRRINCIKDLRAAAMEHGTIMGLKEAKDVVDKVIPSTYRKPETENALTALREKLNAPQEWDYGCGDPECCPPHPVDDYNSATSAYLDEDGDIAFARSREALAERGTWFGAPGPMDEEPF